VNKANTKKQKDKVGSINNKLLYTKKLKERIEELSNQMEFVEGGTILKLRDFLQNYVDNQEE
jgi:hypothetical protein